MEFRDKFLPRSPHSFRFAKLKDIKGSIRSFISRSPETAAVDVKSKNVLKDFYIPDYVLIPGSAKDDIASNTPSCPVIVFINSKSGGQLGGELLVTYRNLLNKNQVIDLKEQAPDKILRQVYTTLQVLKKNGDELATEIERHLRVIVAGGDGTAGWLLGVVSDLKLPQPPPIATVPLGTGNNLPFSFGWGKKNPGTDRLSVESLLEQVKAAKEMKIDSWHIIMRMKRPKKGSFYPFPPLELPHSVHAFRRVPYSDSSKMEGYHTFRGGFWNYFSMGWFMASHFHPSSRNIAQLAKVKVMKIKGQWEDLNIPSSIRSIVCLNLPSFFGGLNPWGHPNRKKLRNRDLTPPYVDDGLIEVVGFRNACHGLVLLAPNGHGTRLAQAYRIRFEFHKGAAKNTFMRIDGEPWKQPLPVDDDTVVVEISNHNQVTMLATPSCRSKSVHDPASPVSYDGDDYDNTDEEDEDWEERRKFGAADAFRYPDEFDIYQLS